MCFKRDGVHDDYCMTCGEDHILYNGTCVGCLSMEVCPFNNSGEIYCIDNSDLSHCIKSRNPSGCSDHACLYGNCGNGIVEGDEECEIGGDGCQGCVCADGWHSNNATNCSTECGDGIVAGSEECENGGDGCIDGMCKCEEGWEKGGQFAPSSRKTMLSSVPPQNVSLWQMRSVM